MHLHQLAEKAVSQKVEVTQSVIRWALSFQHSYWNDFSSLAYAGVDLLVPAVYDSYQAADRSFVESASFAECLLRYLVRLLAARRVEVLYFQTSLHVRKQIANDAIAAED